MKKKLLTSLAFMISGILHAAAVADHVPGEILIKFKAGKKKSFFQSKGSFFGIRESRDINLSYDQFSIVSVEEKGQSLNQSLSLLNQNDDIEYAEPNFIYKVDPIKKIASLKKSLKDFNGNLPDDPLFEKLWGLSNTGTNEPPENPFAGATGVIGADINALKAWDITKGSRAVKIAVIDTGIDYTHPDLKENVWVNEKEANGLPGVDDDGDGVIDDIHGYDFVNNDGDPMDDNGHGSHCSGTIGATHDNKIGVAGVMSEVSLVAVKFLDEKGIGTLEGALKAIDYAAKLDVDIMSNSWGGGGFAESLRDAIQRVSDKGILFVAAAGNTSDNNDTKPSYPASYNIPNIISVAAMTAQNDLASFSSFGKNSVHIAAPGQNILSTVLHGGYDVFSGTSMATPHVSGVLGLLLAKEGRMPHDVLRDRLMMTSVPVSALLGKTVTGGRVDAYNLLTDTRPVRVGPTRNAWIKYPLKTPLESDHPYVNFAHVTNAITIPGAKYIRARVSHFDLEEIYDYVRISDMNGGVVDKVTYKGDNYFTNYVQGNTINIDFISDKSVTKWGYLIEEIEYQ